MREQADAQEIRRDGLAEAGTRGRLRRIRERQLNSVGSISGATLADFLQFFVLIG